MPALVTPDHADSVAVLPKNVISPIATADNSHFENPSSTVQSSGSQSSLGSTPDEDDEFDYEALPENTSLTANLIAGAAAGIMEHTVMYPVDAIKTRMQVAKSANVYSGIVNAVSKISAAEGASSLWRGISSMVMGAGPAHAVYFGVYETVKLKLGGDKVDHTHLPLVSAAAGASATIASDALMNPFDVTKQRMQLNASRQYASTFACMADIYKKEGLSAFYVSYPTTLIMNIPFAAVNFTIYDTTSKLLNPDRKYDPLVHCISGGLAGASAAAVTTPLDVVKTVLQTKAIFVENPAVLGLNSFWDGVKYIYNNNGISGFVRGMRPRIVANMPSTAICWTSYEMAKFYLFKTGMIKE
jgi:solute carrier family 25 iron transporter 28/37